MIFKQLRVIDSRKPININDIKKLELFVAAKLPRDYVDFLMMYNGGHPIRSSYDTLEPIRQQLYEAEISKFYALCKEEDLSIIYNFSLSMQNHDIPPDLLPIGYGSGGDEICLCIRGPNYGKVYFWDVHDQSQGGEEPSYKNVYLIANSFTEFINKLYQEEFDEDGQLVRIDG